MATSKKGETRKTPQKIRTFGSTLNLCDGLDVYRLILFNG